MPDDWPGIFVAGDECHGLAIAIEKAMPILKAHIPSEKTLEAGNMIGRIRRLEEFAATLRQVEIVK